MNSEFFSNRRMELLKQMEPNSFALLFSGSEIYSSNDTLYPFEINRDFYYFTGISKPGIFLLLHRPSPESGTAILFTPRVNDEKEKWTGKMLTKKEATSASGIKEVRYLDEMDERIYSIANRGAQAVYLAQQPLETYQSVPYENALWHQFAERFPALEKRSLSQLTIPLRAVKEPEEVEVMRIAGRITKQAIEEAIKVIKPGVREYEIQAAFEYNVKRHGGGIAFNTIVASGENATSLHYTANDSRVQDGELVLMDCGASYGWYNADVTRTFPVNGVFDDRQLEIYNIVLGANELIIRSVRPGVTLNQLNKTLIDYYAKELKASGLITSEAEISDYYYHGVSHSLGLDVHDNLEKDVDLVPGMVVTVEPGLYFEPYKLGVRIEDDVLVTESGCTVLTDGIVKSPEEIEELMNVWEVK